MKPITRKIIRQTRPQGVQALVGRNLVSPGRSSEPELPDLSGLAPFSEDQSIAVKDTKMEDDSKRVILLNNQTGRVDELDIDWSKTGRARDLEAITPSGEPSGYFAVEGSNHGEYKARLFELKVDSDGGEATQTHLLPNFGQEIEGLVSRKQEDGSNLLIFGGRGDENGNSKLFWGNLSDQGLTFTDDGLRGLDVISPELGPGQRSISELGTDTQGELWATAAIDEGDYGPFTSKFYSLGKLDTSTGRPVLEPTEHSSVPVPGTKLEAMTFRANGNLLVGSDNELLGGQFEEFRFA